MVMLVEGSQGKDVTEIPFQNIVKNKNPNFFFSGFSVMEALLPPDNYTIILAPQDTPRKPLKYKLEVNRVKTPKFPIKKDIKVEEIPLIDFAHTVTRLGE